MSSLPLPSSPLILLALGFVPGDDPSADLFVSFFFLEEEEEEGKAEPYMS